MPHRAGVPKADLLFVVLVWLSFPIGGMAAEEWGEEGLLPQKPWTKPSGLQDLSLMRHACPKDPPVLHFTSLQRKLWMRARAL